MFPARTTALSVWLTLLQLTDCQHTSTHGIQRTGIAVCDALSAAGFTDQLLLPSNSAYEASISSYFSLNAQLRPWCILQPRGTQDVSKAMTALYGVSQFDNVGGLAIRSGGHSAAYAASGIINGITMDLSLMNTTTFNKSTSLASLEPGARWASVYAALSAYNVTVVGGRDGGVGVGGLLVGGGISYFASRAGFACDNVVNFEVVLANGTVIDANKSQNSDLWKALKGGTNNFGVVTRFDVITTPGQELGYSQRIIPFNQSDIYVDALVNFTSDNNDNLNDAIVGTYMHVPGSSETFILLIEVNTAGQMNSTAFGQLNKIPAKVTLNKRWTLATAAKQSQYPGGGLSAGATLTFKNDARIIREGVQLHEDYISFLNKRLSSKNFTTACFFEPIPSSVQKFGRLKGGNMLGLPKGEDLIVWDAGVVLATPSEADLAIAHNALMSWTAQLDKYARSVGGHVELQYANYADASQGVIESYPSQNLQLMRDVSKAYDPMGLFQRIVPGGFKLM